MNKEKTPALVEKIIKANKRTEIMEEMIKLRNDANREIARLEKKGYTFTDAYKRTINKSSNTFTERALESYKDKAALYSVRAKAKPPKKSKPVDPTTVKNRKRLDTARNRAVSLVEELESKGYEFDPKYREKITKPIANKKWYTKQTERAALKYHKRDIMKHAEKRIELQLADKGVTTHITTATANDSTPDKARITRAKSIKSDILWTMGHGPNRERARAITELVYTAQSKGSKRRNYNNEKYVRTRRDKFRANVNKYLRNVSDESFANLLDDYAEVMGMTTDDAIKVFYSRISGLGEEGYREWYRKVYEWQRQTLRETLEDEGGIDMSTAPLNWYEVIVDDYFNTDEWQAYRGDKMKYKPEDVYALETVVRDKVKYDGGIFIKVLGETHDIEEAKRRALK